MKSLYLIFLVGFSVSAQEYKTPVVPKMKWEKTDVNYYKDGNWQPKKVITDSSTTAPAPEDESSPERKPSSGEEVKPKFWDFKIVK